MDSCCLPAETLLTFIKEYQTVATHDTNQHCHTHFYTWQGETTFDETSVYTVYCITIQLRGEIRLCELYLLSYYSRHHGINLTTKCNVDESNQNVRD